MKLLIIICGHELNIKWCDNIRILNNYMKEIDVTYCGISNENDFHNYEDIITFKYKIINTKRQMSKICDFITDYKSELCYDWYMKIRPDIKLLENINFEILSDNAINARARRYYGPKKIKYGMSVGGKGKWENIKESFFRESNESILLDDMMFLFHHNVINQNAFDKIIPEEEGGGEECKADAIYTDRKILTNVIGINLENTKHNVFSGDLNYI